MRIAFFNSIATWGGGEKWHYEASVFFANAGHDVYFFGSPKGVIASKLQDNKAINFIPIQLSNSSFLNPFKLFNLKKKFKRLHLDILIINHPGDLKIAAHAAYLAKIPHIVYRRGSAIPIKDRMFNRYIFKNWVTAILANSQATKNTITALNHNLFPIEEIKVIYNPIDITSFIEKPYNSIIDRSNNILKIGSLGRLSHEKNHKFLIDVSKRLTELAIAHNIYIGGTGEMEKELKEYSKLQGTEENVVFVGFLNNVKDLLMAIDLFILPSLWEGFGYVVAEASACKKPVIAFNVSSLPELIQEGKTGYLVPVNDVDVTVERIQRLKDPILREKMGENGFEYCNQTFEKSKITKQLENYFNDMVALK